MKTSWRRLLSSSSENAFTESSRRLYQDEYICLGHMFSRRLQDVFKTSSKCLAKTSSRHLPDVLKACWRCLENFFKMSSRCVQEVFKTSSKCIAKISSRHLPDTFKTYHQVKLFLLTRLQDNFTSLQDVFETYSTRFWDAMRRWLSTEIFA